MSAMRQIAVTGAASGLGKALRARLEAGGARVVGVDIAGCEISADLSSPGGRAAAAAGITSACGGVLDALVPCAGLGPQHPSERIIAVNFFGAIACLDGLVEQLAHGSQPAVVLICSNSTTLTPGIPPALVDACLAGDEAGALAQAAEVHPAVAYAASKIAIARAMRRRVSALAERGIRINAVAPGAFQTPLLQQGLDDPETGDLIRSLPIPLGHIGQPDDIAAVVEWLLGDGSRYVHGSTLFADGGTDALLFPDRFP
jgi:NAD(P)-dependent dehydrogenase (short-subunit alcohol dehydrogenase family)